MEAESEEEDLESGLNFDSPLQSPQRPLPTREGSLVGLVKGGPILADNVDGELEEVQWRLNDIAKVRAEVEDLTDLLGDTDTRVGTDPLEGAGCDNPQYDLEEIVDEGLVVGDVTEKDLNMPDNDAAAVVVVNITMYQKEVA